MVFTMSDQNRRQKLFMVGTQVVSLKKFNFETKYIEAFTETTYPCASTSAATDIREINASIKCYPIGQLVVSGLRMWNIYLGDH